MTDGSLRTGEGGPEARRRCHCQEPCGHPWATWPGPCSQVLPSAWRTTPAWQVRTSPTEVVPQVARPAHHLPMVPAEGLGAAGASVPAYPRHPAAQDPVCEGRHSPYCLLFPARGSGQGAHCHRGCLLRVGWFKKPLAGTVRYPGQLLVPAEGFGLCPRLFFPSVLNV